MQVAVAGGATAGRRPKLCSSYQSPRRLIRGQRARLYHSGPPSYRLPLLGDACLVHLPAGVRPPWYSFPVSKLAYKNEGSDVHALYPERRGWECAAMMGAEEQ